MATMKMKKLNDLFNQKMLETEMKSRLANQRYQEWRYHKLYKNVEPPQTTFTTE